MNKELRSKDLVRLTNYSHKKLIRYRPYKVRVKTSKFKKERNSYCDLAFMQLLLELQFLSMSQFHLHSA